MPDIELWTSFTDGRKDAFSDLFRRFYPLLYQYGIKMSPDHGVVEDVIQELFLELWHKPPLQAVASPKAYLLACVKFKLYKGFRDGKRLQVVGSDTPEIFDLYPEESGATPGEDEQVAAKIRAAVQRLPPRQKEVIYLKLYKGLSYEEVGEVMSLNYQVVRNLLCSAIKSLKKLYASCLLAAAVLMMA